MAHLFSPRRREDALAVIEEAVAAYRQLGRARPAVYVARLNSPLIPMAEEFAVTGRESEAYAEAAKAGGLK